MPKIKITPFAWLLSFFIVYSMPPKALLCYVTAVLLHEAGHVIAALLVKSPIESITFSLLGINIRRKSVSSSHLHDILIYSAGPFMSLLGGVLGQILSSPLLAVFSYALLFLNMLPVKLFDGGKILYSLLCLTLPAHAEVLSKALSAGILLLMWLAAVYFLIVTSEVSLFILCIYLFFVIFI